MALKIEIFWFSKSFLVSKISRIFLIFFELLLICDFIPFFSASQPSKPYLSTLSQTELEKVGLKAVAAGANPQKLQQAFATAQLQGDWSKLEKLISDELGVAAINPAETGLAAAAQSTGAFSRVFHDCLQ